MPFSVPSTTSLTGGFVPPPKQLRMNVNSSQNACGPFKNSPLSGHPQEVFTVEEMMPHVQHMKGGHSKNLFLKDKKKKGFWLVTVLHNRQVNLNDLAKKLGVGSGNLRFADENAMLEKLKVGQGCATPLALFCDQGDVRFVLDAGFLEGGHEKVYFHPMTNSATMGLSPDDFLKFVRSTGHDPIIIHFDEDIQ
ncbi:prolyl-trna synthetase associated domain-containing protein 1-like [Limosa lapponica baueri]|uniref:PrdX deacylase domain-containing protein 1 n=1 Tax=Limosa lapponica baueri TaxID=1758121 RepID=A0A2I0UF46_LIMLA|nr:prolyl-trna synthetase associated domain-containing protein 1-like [Limosa lapponica baueri]